MDETLPWPRPCRHPQPKEELVGLFDDQVALVIGGTSGIGARTAELLVAEGGRVAIAGRRHAEGKAIADRLDGLADFVSCDVTVESDVARAIAFTVDRFGSIDALVNSAGGGVREQRGVAAAELGALEATVAVHLGGVIAAMKHAAPRMVEQRSGSIVNIASVGGRLAGWSALGYSAAKAAVIHVTRCAAVELGESGVRVNSISPGPILTGIFGKSVGLDPADADRRARELESLFESLVRPWQPIPRAGVADDVARAAVWLASDASRFVNGHDLVVDGGICAGRPFSTSHAHRERIASALAGASEHAGTPS
jgi:NAD(P)-dependent dehydrogenase (short-subunit alcohol dehydrogenase family)